MANLIDQKLSSGDFAGNNIAALPDKPTITAAQLKARFDDVVEDIVTPKHNAVIDILLDTTLGVSGAEQIGSAAIAGVSGTTARAQIADVKSQLDNSLADPRVFPDGSVTTAKIADEAVTLDKIDPDALDWGNIGSKPSTFTPAAHNQDASTITTGAFDTNRIPTLDQTKITGLSYLTANKTVYVATTGNDTTGTGLVGAPYRTIQKGVDSLSKIQNGFTGSVNIAAGTYAESVSVKDFSGDVYFESSGAVVVTAITVNNCKLLLNTGAYTINGTLRADPMGFINQGSGATITVVNAGGSGLYATNGTIFLLYGVTVNNCTNAVIAVNNGNIIIGTNIAGSGNTTGLNASLGGKIAYQAKTITATTEFATSYGGRIYTGAQASAPSY